MAYNDSVYAEAIRRAEEDGDFKQAASFRVQQENDKALDTKERAKVGLRPEGDIMSYGDDAVKKFSTSEDNAMRLQFAAQGASLGLADDVSAFVSATDELFDQDADFNGVMDNKAWFGDDGRLEAFWDTSRAITKDNAEGRAEWAAQNQGEALLFEIGGALLTGGVGVAKAGATLGRKGAALGLAEGSVANTAFVGAGIAGSQGAVYGMGTLDAKFDEVTDMAWHVGTMTGLSAGMGAGLGAGVKALTNKMGALKKAQTTKDANNVIDMVNEAYITARIDNPTASPAEMNALVRDSDIGSLYNPDMIKAAIAAGNKKLHMPNKATQDTLTEYRTQTMRDNFEDTPQTWLTRLGEKLDNSQGEGALNGVDKIVGAVATRIKNIDPRIHGALMKHDFNVQTLTQDRLTLVKDIERLNAKGMEHIKAAVKKTMLEDDVLGTFRILEQHGDVKLLNAFKEAQKMNRTIREGFAEVGPAIKHKGPYWGRVVSDPVALKKAIGSTGMSKLDTQLLKRANDKLPKGTPKMKKSEANMAKARELLSDAEYQEVLGELITKGMLTVKPKYKTSQAAATMDRGVKNPSATLNRETGVVHDLTPFYADPVEAITQQIRRNTENIEERRFLGARQSTNGDPTAAIDVESSVAEYLTKMGITDDQSIAHLTGLLSSRLGMGKVAPSRFLSDIKNIGLMSVLATPKAAMIQVADIGHSVLYNGFRNTLKAVGQKNGLTTESIGMGNKLGAEFAQGGDVATTAKLVNGMLESKFTMFAHADRFGKQTYMKAAYLKQQQMVKSPAGRIKFAAKYEAAFGPADTAKLMDELASPAGMSPSPNMRLMMFHELSEIQPLTLSQMPQAYLDHPNGRITYTLKSFALKQLDQLRRNVAHPLMKGNVAEAGKNLTAYMLITGSATYATNEVRNAIFTMGADPIEFNAEEMPMELAWHLLAATGFMSKFSVTQGLTKKDPVQILAQSLIPPTGIIGAGIHDVYKVLAEEWDDENMQFSNMETVKALPMGIGGYINMLYGDGQEKKFDQYQKREAARYEAELGVKRGYTPFNQYKRD